MPDILLATLNARYIHAAVGLRCLHANLGDLQGRAEIMEFDINQRPADIAETLLAARPRIIGLGIYIWNVEPTTELVAILKRVVPEIAIVLGGPEVSHPPDLPPVAEGADHIITGEADLAFAELCRALLAGQARPRILRAAPPPLDALRLPYDAYTDEDLAHRILYVEASRGCPFSCEFCLSSLDAAVRAFDLDRFLTAMEHLIARGARTFKFLDRTFNLDLRTSVAILRFFLERWQPGMFLHFEMVPDRFPVELREWLARFPPGALQLEVGIQSFNPEVTARISRRQNTARVEDNLRFLRAHTGAHVHADLILGLPGEDLYSIADGFDRLWRLGPQEIQVGILKRLRGTPIIRHDTEFGMVYAPRAPYELLCNRDLDFATVQRLKRFARFWDLVANSGRFRQTLPLLLEHRRHGSPFRNFLEFSDFLYQLHGRQHAISPENFGRDLHRLLADWGADRDSLDQALAADFTATDARRAPAWLAASPHARRQQRHGGG
jgi:radical SAM superfamily enzyme YgiQ (UPF0313 family)